MVIEKVFALLIGYLLGSIPAAYIAARVTAGQDIRRMGGGNVGAFNTFREAGTLPGLAVAVFDIGKGTAAVAIAYWWLDVPELYVMLAGLAAVMGHMWMLFLKFSGGKGMGAACGALAVLLPIYGYWYGVFIFGGIILVPYLVTCNLALALGAGLIALPLMVWLMAQSGTAAILSVVLGWLVCLKFLPTARTAWSKSRDMGDFVCGH